MTVRVVTNFRDGTVKVTFAPAPPGREFIFSAWPQHILRTRDSSDWQIASLAVNTLGSSMQTMLSALGYEVVLEHLT